MVAGLEKYYQIARCFRDEDLRADRQPEFTQVDIEASFVTADDVMAVVEAILIGMWDEAGEAVTNPFQRLSYAEAMERFGIDKPDLRYGFEIRDVGSLLGPDAAPFLSARPGNARFRGI